MIAYLEMTEAIRNHLLSDEDINTVVIGDLSQVDVAKQTMFPLAHLFVGSTSFINGMVRFSVTVSTMDIVDINKNNTDKTSESWKGHDNRQYIQNTMLGVLENLDKEIDRGDMADFGYEMIGDATAEPFEDRFENLLVGWSMTFTLDVPNTVQNCP